MITKMYAINKFLKGKSYLGILLAAVLLRFFLALVNREANDNHLDVIKRLLDGLPAQRGDCWECFQPKFYYHTVLAVVKALNLRSDLEILMTAQFASVAAGGVTLLVIWKFMTTFLNSYKYKILAFTFVAFLPTFIGINAQATNDSFAILFGVTSFYLLLSYVRREGLIGLLCLALAVSLAILSKATGFVSFLAVFLVLLINSFVKSIRDPHKSLLILHFILFIFIVVFITFNFSPFYRYFQKYGSPIVTNTEKDPPPEFFKKTYLHRPGVVSVVDGFFTFKFVSLLQYPYIDNWGRGLVENRTSLWTQLYGRFNSVFFEQWPPSWQRVDELILNFNRIVFIAAIPTFSLITLGFFLSVIMMLYYFSTFKFLHFMLEGSFILYFLAFLFMSIYYSVTHRDFSVMKTIYILPVLPCMARFLLEGVEYVSNKFSKHKILTLLFSWHFLALIFLYIANILLLIFQLKK